MKRLTSLALILLLADVAVEPPASATGSFGQDADPEGMLPPECRVINVSLKNIGTDLPTPAASYISNGTCLIKYSSNLKGEESTFDKVKVVGTIEWTAQGTYQPLQKNAWEDISIRQTYLDRPGFVSQGILTGWGTCAKDPWREPDGQACGSPGYKTAGAVEAAVGKFYGRALRVPLTSILNAQQRAALKTAYNAAVQKAQLVKVVAVESASKATGQLILASATTPSVVSPAANQTFVERTPIPIKLTSPKSLNATLYMVNIEVKNPNGTWSAQATIPVGVAQAQSAAGYTGFGAGAPPAFLALPGTFRINAQVSSPKQSAPSPWVVFSVKAR